MPSTAQAKVVFSESLHCGELVFFICVESVVLPLSYNHKKEKISALCRGALLLMNLDVLVNDTILDEVQIVGRCCSVILCV